MNSNPAAIISVNNDEPNNEDCLQPQASYEEEEEDSTLLRYMYGEKEGAGKGQGKAQRGFITNYLTSLTTDQIISNTLTGFLVNLIRKRGNIMQFSNIVALTHDRFTTLRKPNGKAYNHTSGNLKRSIMCSLTSNGVFQKVAASATIENSQTTLAQRDISKELWQVSEERATEYFIDMRAKLESQKQKLDNRKRQYPAAQSSIKKELAKIIAKDPSG